MAVFNDINFVDSASVTWSQAAVPLGGSVTATAAGSTPSLIVYTSPAIDATTTGLTTVFTTNGSGSFIPISITAVCDSQTLAIGDGLFSLGWTAAAYTDWIPASTFGVVTADEFNAIAVPSQVSLPPISTAMVLNLTVPDSGTALMVRVIITGIYIT